MSKIIVLKMAEKIGRKADLTGLALQPIHELNHTGELQGAIIFGKHKMTIRNWWEDCGATGEDVTCSCGFESHEFSGNGCWQQGHDGPAVEHSFNLIHNAIYLVAKEWEKNQGVYFD